MALGHACHLGYSFTGKTSLDLSKMVFKTSWIESNAIISCGRPCQRNVAKASYVMSKDRDFSDRRQLYICVLVWRCRNIFVHVFIEIHLGLNDAESHFSARKFRSKDPRLTKFSCVSSRPAEPVTNDAAPEPALAMNAIRKQSLDPVLKSTSTLVVKSFEKISKWMLPGSSTYKYATLEDPSVAVPGNTVHTRFILLFPKTWFLFSN